MIRKPVHKAVAIAVARLATVGFPPAVAHAEGFVEGTPEAQTADVVRAVNPERENPRIIVR